MSSPPAELWPRFADLDESEAALAVLGGATCLECKKPVKGSRRMRRPIVCRKCAERAVQHGTVTTREYWFRNAYGGWVE